MLADAIAHALEVVPRVDVVAQSRQVERAGAEPLLEARRAALPVQRLEVARVPQRERVRRSVCCCDERRRGCAQRLELGRCVL